MVKLFLNFKLLLKSDALTITFPVHTVAPCWQMPVLWQKLGVGVSLLMESMIFFGIPKPLHNQVTHLYFRFWWNTAADTCNWKVKSNGNGANRRQNVSTGSSNSWCVGFCWLLELLGRNFIAFAIICHILLNFFVHCESKKTPKHFFVILCNCSGTVELSNFAGRALRRAGRFYYSFFQNAREK